MVLLIIILLIPAFVLGLFYGIRAGKKKAVKIIDTLEKEKKRFESKARYYHAVVDNSSDILVTTDNEANIVKINRVAEATFGIEGMEWLGKKVELLFKHPKRIRNFLEHRADYSELEEFVASNRKTNELVHLAVRQSKIWRAEDKPLSVQNNSVYLGHILCCENITHRKLLENELKQKNEQLTQLSLTDSLTNLFNMRHFHAEATRFQKIQDRYPDRELSLALLDVDRFKKYNDAYGHVAGDQLLSSLSQIITSQIRTDLDTAYRYGGDEFVLLLPDTGEEGAVHICKRILVKFSQLTMEETSVSIGITQYFRDWGNLTANLLIQKADLAMYKVKALGGNGIHVYGKPLSPELSSRENLYPAS